MDDWFKTLNLSIKKLISHQILILSLARRKLKMLSLMMVLPGTLAFLIRQQKLQRPVFSEKSRQTTVHRHHFLFGLCRLSPFLKVLILLLSFAANRSLIWSHKDSVWVFELSLALLMDVKFCVGIFVLTADLFFQFGLLVKFDFFGFNVVDTVELRQWLRRHYFISTGDHQRWQFFSLFFPLYLLLPFLFFLLLFLLFLLPLLQKLIGRHFIRHKVDMQHYQIKQQKPKNCHHQSSHPRSHYFPQVLSHLIVYFEAADHHMNAYHNRKGKSADDAGHKSFVISFSYAIVEPHAMVVENTDASVATSTMLWCGPTVTIAKLTVQYFIVLRRKCYLFVETGPFIVVHDSICRISKRSHSSRYD